MTERDPSDELLARYREASTADPRVPAERVRAAVRAHAQMVVDAGQLAAQTLPHRGVQPPPKGLDPPSVPSSGSASRLTWFRAVRKWSTTRLWATVKSQVLKRAVGW